MRIYPIRADFYPNRYGITAINRVAMIVQGSDRPMAGSSDDSNPYLQEPAH
nr:hypothetical protein PJ912_22220 [Pectobacterium colocasium]